MVQSIKIVKLQLVEKCSRIWGFCRFEIATGQLHNKGKTARWSDNRKVAQFGFGHWVCSTLTTELQFYKCLTIQGGCSNLKSEIVVQLNDLQLKRKKNAAAKYKHTLCTHSIHVWRITQKVGLLEQYLVHFVSLVRSLLFRFDSRCLPVLSTRALDYIL